MLFAASPIPDSQWVPAVLVLIFAVPIGAFLSLYAAATAFMFQNFRQGVPVFVLNASAFMINGCALLFLMDSQYSANRYLVVPLIAWIFASSACSITLYRAVGMSHGELSSHDSPWDE